MTRAISHLPANDDFQSLVLPRMSPESPTKEPKTAPPPSKPDTAPPQREPVAPGRRPDPGEKPAPECPDSTCPAP